MEVEVEWLTNEQAIAIAFFDDTLFRFGLVDDCNIVQHSFYTQLVRYWNRHVN